MSETEVLLKLGAVEAKADAAHGRLDRHEQGMREDLKDIKHNIAEIREWQHKTQGRDATLFVIGTVLGSVVSFVAHKLFP